MATVIALSSFVGRLEADVLGPDRIEKHSEFPTPSVFPGGEGFPAGSLQRKITKAGKSIQVQKGQALESNHPAVKKWPPLFGEQENVTPVEQATKAADKQMAGYKTTTVAASTAA